MADIVYGVKVIRKSDDFLLDVFWTGYLERDLGPRALAQRGLQVDVYFIVEVCK
jgi:hypothetical protein